MLNLTQIGCLQVLCILDSCFAALGDCIALRDPIHQHCKMADTSDFACTVTSFSEAAFAALIMSLLHC